MGKKNKNVFLHLDYGKLYELNKLQTNKKITVLIFLTMVVQKHIDNILKRKIL